MIIVDTALARRAAEARPIQFGLFGAGFMGRGIINQMRYLDGIRCAAVCNRTIDKAVEAVQASGADVDIVSSSGELDDAIRRGAVGVTDDPAVLCGSNLHCQWRVEAFAADVLLDIALDPDLIVGAAEAHGLRAIDLCLAAGECSENDAATMRACFQGACE